MNECGGNVEEGKLIFWMRVDKVHTHSRTCPTVQITFRFMLHVIPWKLCRARLAKLGNGSVHLSHHHSSCRLSKLGKSCNKTRGALQEENCKKLLWQKRSVDSRIYLPELSATMPASAVWRKLHIYLEPSKDIVNCIFSLLRDFFSHRCSFLGIQPPRHSFVCFHLW